jgi:putative hydrolase of the HAD superfamily
VNARPSYVVFDYGGVLCRPFQAWSALAALLSAPAAAVEVAYWRHRHGYDVDSDDERYWAAVASDLGSSVSVDRVRLLVTTDVTGWLHLADGVESLLHDVRSSGTATALLSNAPGSLATAIERQAWAAPVRHRVFSSRIGAVKPHPAAYAALIETLGIPAERCVFFDDRIENVEGASDAGLCSHLWRGVELGRVTLSEYGVLA